MNREPTTGNRKPETGIAMVIVLWVITLLSVIAVSMGYAMRTEVALASHLVSSANAYALAEAGVYHTIKVLSSASADQEPAMDGSSEQWSFADGKVDIAIQNESGRIDLNAAQPELLAGLLESVGQLSPEDAEDLAAAIVDWRDSDDKRTPGGAEKRDYHSAGLSYTAKNAPFDSINELGEVLGMTEEVLGRIKPALTVFLYRPGINPNYSSKPVLMAVPGISEEDVDAFISERDERRAQGLAPPSPPAGMGEYLSMVRARVYRIAAIAHSADGGVVRIEAMAGLQPRGKQPFTIFAWRDGELAGATKSGADYRQQTEGEEQQGKGDGEAEQ